MSQDYLDLYRQVLDRQLLDANHIPCGKVDDVELEIGEGGELKITALLVGAGVWAERLPVLFRWLALKLFGNRVIKIPWEEVAIIGNQIKLHSRAGDLGLAAGDRKLADWFKRLPGGA